MLSRVGNLLLGLKQTTQLLCAVADIRKSVQTNDLTIA